MTKTKSVSFFQTLMIIVATILAVAGISVLTNIRNIDNTAGAINPTYANAYIYKYTSTWDDNSSQWGTPTEEISSKTSINVNSPVLLNMPTITETEDKNIYTLTWYGIRFVLGDNTNRISSLTGRVRLNGVAIRANAKTTIADNGVVPYHEYWIQNIYAVTENYFENTNTKTDTKSKEYRADQLLSGKSKIEIAEATKDATDDDKETTTTTTNEDGSITITTVTIENGSTTTTTETYTPTTVFAMYYTDGKAVSDLEGRFGISYTYAPEGGSSTINETFSFDMLTSKSHDVNKDITFNYNTFSANSIEEAKNVDSTNSIRTYNRQYYYQFNQVNNNEDNLAFPVLTYDPEKFEISYLLTQYNYQETVTLKFGKTKSTKTETQGTTTTETATLTMTKSYNNGDPTTTTVYTATTTKNATSTETIYSYKNPNRAKVLEYTDDGTYKVNLTFMTPGLYEFDKKIVLDTSSTNWTTASYTYYGENDIEVPNDSLLFTPEALRILGYTVTYADNGITQKPLYNDESETVYLSDFSFLLGDNQMSTTDFGEVEVKDDKGNTVTDANGNAVKKPANYDPETYITEILNKQNSKRVMATTNQAPVIFSADFYLPDYQSTITGWSYNATTNEYFKVDKTTTFTKEGKYYVIMQYTGTPYAHSNVTDEKETKKVYQLFAFEIKRSHVQPTIYKDTATEDGTDYYEAVTTTTGSTTENKNDETMGVDEYTNQNVYLGWQTTGPFEHQIVAEWYYNSAYTLPTTSSTYSTLEDLKNSNNMTYTRLFKDNGYYRIKLTANNTTSYYGFYIDKEDITNIHAYTFDGTNYTKINEDDATETTAGTTALTNSTFVWSWKDKPSKANITAVRYFAPIYSSQDFECELLSTTKDSTSTVSALTANGKIEAFGTQAISYKKPDSNDNGVPTADNLISSQKIKNAGVYVLCLTDSAGNKAYFVTILDNTAPSLYVCKSDDTSKRVTETTISDDVDVYWTANKAIKTELTINADDSTIKVIKGLNVKINPKYFNKYVPTTTTVTSESLYLTTPNAQLDITKNVLGSSKDTEGNSKTLNDLTFNKKTVDHVKIDVDTDTITVSVIANDTDNIFSNISLSNQDVQFIFNLTDQANNASKKTLLVSLDQTLLRMYAYSSASSIGDENNYREICNSFGTNRSIETIKWQTPKNPDLEIEYITIAYYKLLDNLGTATSTYPYDENSPTVWTIYSKDGKAIKDENNKDINSTVDKLLGFNAYSTTDNVMYITNALNTQVLNGIDITQPGKYVVTRQYTDETSTKENLNGDQKTRTYMFVVDRNATISEVYAKYTLSYGYDSTEYPNYSDYGKSTTDTGTIAYNQDTKFGLLTNDEKADDGKAAWDKATYKVSGNKVKISLNYPEYNSIAGYKYIPSPSENSEESINLDLSTYSNILTTVVCVQYYSGTSSAKIDNSYYTYNAIGEKYQTLNKLADAFQKTGKYRVMVYDLANAQSGLSTNPELDLNAMLKEAPNFNVFYFEITDEAPSGTFNSKSSVESNYNPVTTQSGVEYYTNDDYVMFVFSDPENQFNAKIAYKDVSVTSSYQKFNNTVGQSTTTTLSFDTANKISNATDIGSKDTSTPTLYYYTNQGTKLSTYYVVLPKATTSATYNAQLDTTYSITLHYIQSAKGNEFSGRKYESTSTIFVDHTAPYTNLTRLINNDDYLNEIDSLFSGTKNYILTHLDDPDFDFLNHYVFTVNEDFYLIAGNSKDTNEARYKIYANNSYQGTTATVISSNNYYPDNSTRVSYYVTNYPKTNQDNVLSISNPGANYRPFKAGNYYDIIESDTAGNYRVYTIYVTGSTTNDTTDDTNKVVDSTNLYSDEFKSTTMFAKLNLLDTTNTNGTTKTTLSTKYFGVNSANANDIENTVTYSKLNYSESTFTDISTNGNYNASLEAISTNNTLYWQIIKYSVATSLTQPATTKTILYFPSDDINSALETSNQIDNLQTMLKLGNNQAVTFINSKADLLSTLNSIIIDAYNANQNTTGAKITFSFVNKLSGNPYYSVDNVLDSNNKVTFKDNGDAIFSQKGLSIMTSYDLVFNTKGLDIVNTTDDFVASRGTNTFTIKIPTPNISTMIEHIYLNPTSTTIGQDLISNGQLTNNTFSLSQSNKFQFVDNFGLTKTIHFPIDSEYIQELTFKDGNSLNSYNGNTYYFTCGDVQFVYDSNHLTTLNITITDLGTGKIIYPVTETDTKENSDTEEQIDNNDETTIVTYFTSTVNNDGTTTILFIAMPNVQYKYDISVGSASDNLTTYSFILYTIFPSVTITDTNGANMMPSNGETLVTSKDLLIGLVQNTNALYNPHVYLTSDKYTTEIVSQYDTLVNENGVYTISFQNDIGRYSLATITFTRRTYDISIYGVYYNNNNNYSALSKQTQGYTYKIEETDADGNENIKETRYIDRYFFLSPSDTGWNNIVVLLNENKQLQLVRDANNNNYIDTDSATNTRIYHVTGTGAYKIDVYFAITRIPTATTDLVEDFRINGVKPLSSNLTQIYPTTEKPDYQSLSAELTWTPDYIFGTEDNQKIPGFYMLEIWLNGTYIGSDTSGTFTLSNSGTYTLQIHDILGQYKTFSAGSLNYTITIYKNVVFSVNQNYPIQNATFNDSVTVSVSNISQYQQGFEFNVTRNSAFVDAELTNGEYTFEAPGVYIITMSGKLSGMGNNVETLSSEYRFTIISANEARTNYEFNKRSGYTITGLKKDGEALNVTPLYSLNLDANDNNNSYGKGKFEITVSVKGEGLIPTMDYTYTIWINNETAILNSTRDWGTASTAPFTLKLNPSVVHTRIGNCYVTINGETVLTINENNSNSNEEISYTCSNPGVYVVQMYSQSGNLISSQRITINEPLNTVAIVLIALLIVIIVALTIMFVVIRKRQKVK